MPEIFLSLLYFSCLPSSLPLFTPLVFSVHPPSISSPSLLSLPPSFTPPSTQCAVVRSCCSRYNGASLLLLLVLKLALSPTPLFFPISVSFHPPPVKKKGQRRGCEKGKHGPPSSLATSKKGEQGRKGEIPICYLDHSPSPITLACRSHEQNADDGIGKKRRKIEVEERHNLPIFWIRILDSHVFSATGKKED